MRLKRDGFDKTHDFIGRMFPWIFGAILTLVVLWFVALAVVAWTVVGAAVDAGPDGIANAIGKFLATVQQGAGK